MLLTSSQARGVPTWCTLPVMIPASGPLHDLCPQWGIRGGDHHRQHTQSLPFSDLSQLTSVSWANGIMVESESNGNQSIRFGAVRGAAILRNCQWNVESPAACLPICQCPPKLLVMMRNLGSIVATRTTDGMRPKRKAFFVFFRELADRAAPNWATTLETTVAEHWHSSSGCSRPLWS